MRHVAVKIAYLGEGFHGSQRQPVGSGLRTVESEILTKVHLVDKVPPDETDLRFASRTDAGVNSMGNVISFFTEFKDDYLLLKALNSVSEGVYYLSVADVPDWFNPRLDAKRSYRYSCPSERIDLDAFTRAAKVFEGHHDFKRFAKVGGQRRSTVMAIDSIEVRTNGDLIETDFVADYFLWHMIRRIMAAVIQVGKHLSDLDDVLSKLDGNDGTFGLAKPEGLTLLDVWYEGVTFRPPEKCPYPRRLSYDLYRDSLNRAFHEDLRDRYPRFFQSF